VRAGERVCDCDRSLHTQRSSDSTLSLASINRPGLSSPGQHQAAACHIVGLACEHPVVSSAVLCDGNVPLTMSLETRSNSALMKRAEQLKRWQDSETAREPGDLKRKKRRIGFSDGCVFLAACAACDRDEVRSLISRGTDIDTANVDGLTALHQACIDDNLEMVEFLVGLGADVNRGDNEGWTPLHATASCGFLSIAKYLLENNADPAAVNNDGELAIDISESDEMEDLLQKEIDARSINCEEARNLEEQCMLNDARDWKNSGYIADPPHSKTGASALHVAAAKGYMKVMNLLIQAGMEVNIQDYDGWTPMHAATHWAQREACELLAENFANMETKNCVGQTPFDVADPDVLRLLEELKKKQNTLQKNNPAISVLINRPPSTPNSNRGGRSINNLNSNSNHVDIIRTNANNVSNNIANDRSSITRLSQQDKIHSTREATVKETIKEEKSSTGNLEHESDKESSTDNSESGRDDLSLPDPLSTPFHTARIYQSSIPANKSRPLDSPGVVVTDELGKEAPGFVPPHPEANSGKDDAASWRRPGSLRARPTTSGKLSPSSEDLVTVRRAHSFGSDEKFYAKLAELRQRIRANSMPVLNKDLDSLPDASKANLENLTKTSTLPNPRSHRKHTPVPLLSTSSLPRPGKKPQMQTVLESQQLTLDLDSEKPPLPPKPSPPQFSKFIISPQPFRRTDDAKLTMFAGHTPLQQLTNTSPHDAEWRKAPEDGISKQSPDLRPRSSENLSGSRNNLVSGGGTQLQGQVRRSFVPPVRDEEHEIQRKAHAKRVRETRRSTQGVTLEDLKSAEQLVKKKQQAENAARTTELQQLVINSPGGGASPAPGPASPALPGSTAGTTVTTTATLVAGNGDNDNKYERRPSWRLRMESSDKNRFTLEDARERLANLHGSPAGERRTQVTGSGSRLDPASVREQRHSIHVLTSSSPNTPSHGGEVESGPGSGAATPTTLNPAQRKKKPKRRSTGVVNIDFDDPRSEESADEGAPLGSSQASQELKKSNLKSQNGEIDYKKLWEASQSENSKLRTEMGSIRSDLDSTRHQLEAAIQASTKNSISDSEKREKKMLEKKLSEMEEELKTLEQLRADNQRLRDENGALIRVISKLSK